MLYFLGWLLLIDMRKESRKKWFLFIFLYRTELTITMSMRRLQSKWVFRYGLKINSMKRSWV